MLITSRTNERVKHYVNVRRNVTANHPWFVVEGDTLIREVANSEHVIEQLFVIKGFEHTLAGIPAREKYIVTTDVMLKISALSSPSSVAALCRRAPLPSVEEILATTPWLVLDGVQDPGNVGTIFRSAEAFGRIPVILLPPAPSPFHEKVLRSGAGSSIRTPYWRPADHAALIQKLKQHHLPLYVLDPRGEMDLDKFRGEGSAAFLIGNEGHGMSEVLIDKVTGTLRIPMESGVESLNAAMTASVLLYQLYRRRTPRAQRKTEGKRHDRR